MHACMYARMYVCMYVCKYVCMYVRMYVCLYVCTYACIHTYIRHGKLKIIRLWETGCYASDTSGFRRQRTIAQTINNLENNYVIFWQSEINSSEKLDFLRIYKQGFHTVNI